MFRQIFHITKFKNIFSCRKLSILTISDSQQKCCQINLTQVIKTNCQQSQLINNNNNTLGNFLSLRNYSDHKIDDLELRDRESEKNVDTKNEETENSKRLIELREKILNASLSFVTTHGWTRHAIGKGAESIGYPGVAHGMFPNGGIELVQHFYQNSNQKLTHHLKDLLKDDKIPSNPNHLKDVLKDGKIPTKPTDFAKEAIKFRLILLTPYLTMWPQALALMSLPQNTSTSLANLLTLVDDICFYSGDRSVDFAWYLRRIGLASIYKMTELYMMQDKSIDFSKTWEFLDRRIEDAIYLHEFIDQSEKVPENVQKVFGSAFSTARNILGTNFNRN